MDPKCIPNEPQIGVMLGSSWGRLGVILGSSWGHLGVVLGSFDRLRDRRAFQGGAQAGAVDPDSELRLALERNAKLHSLFDF